MNTNLRPPAVPLITVDPYFNIWSMGDKLYNDNTKHWTGKDNSLTGLISIDGIIYRFMGKTDEPIFPIIEQTNLIVDPLSTIITFKTNSIEFKLKFTTPLLLDNPDILSRPATYITLSINSLDKKNHDVKVFFTASSELCVNSKEQEVIFGRKNISNNIESMYIGTKEQPILKSSGDDIRIDWGYVNLSYIACNNISTCINNYKTCVSNFINNISHDSKNTPPFADNNMPVMAITINFKAVNTNTASSYFVLAYDDVYSVQYMGENIKAYYARYGKSFDEMLAEVFNDYNSLMDKCDTFDIELISDAKKSGGDKYADILSLSYRQTIAAHKLVSDKDGNILFFSKECFSNGCMGTVDVSYPSIPLFLIYNPEFIKGMIRPIFDYAKSDKWPYEFAPHDIGRYPLANGQVYGLKDNEFLLEKQMPVEECGNMLIMTAAICKAEKSAAFALCNWDILTSWAEYLKSYGLDPGSQLCTDDFAGHLAHNTNLSIKAIMGIASYSIMCSMLNREDTAKDYLDTAKSMADEWVKMADAGDHYKLTFDSSNSWSMKYNLIWDKYFNTNIFPAEVSKKEIAYYITIQNKYGLPLDSRATYTKSDWLIWCASMAENSDDFNTLISPIWDFLNITPCRVPFTDWYDTVSSMQERCACHIGKRGFRNRTVQGGLFMKLLMDNTTSI